MKRRETVSYATLIGFEIQLLRKHRRITQDELARKMRISPATLSKLETRSQDFTLEQVWKCAQCLKVSPEVLFNNAARWQQKLEKQSVRVVAAKGSLSREDLAYLIL